MCAGVIEESRRFKARKVAQLFQVTVYSIFYGSLGILSDTNDPILGTLANRQTWKRNLLTGQLLDNALLTKEELHFDMDHL